MSPFRSALEAALDESTNPHDPIAQLLHFHGRLRRSLAELHALSATRDLAVARASAGELEAFFSKEIAYHDLDEEVSLLPRLRETAHDERLARSLRACHAAHDRIEDETESIFPRLKAMSLGLSDIEPIAVVDLHARLSRLLLPHMRLEEEEIFPQARALLTPGVLHEIADEMTRRRTDRHAGRSRVVEISGGSR